MFISNRFTVALATAVTLIAMATTVPAAAAPASPQTIAASVPVSKTVEGTVTNWNDATNSFQTKATVMTWTFSYDAAKLQKVGTPSVGARVKVTYHKNGKAFVADKVEVVKKAK